MNSDERIDGGEDPLYDEVRLLFARAHQYFNSLSVRDADYISHIATLFNLEWRRMDDKDVLYCHLPDNTELQGIAALQHMRDEMRNRVKLLRERISRREGFQPMHVGYVRNEGKQQQMTHHDDSSQDRSIIHLFLKSVHMINRGYDVLYQITKMDDINTLLSDDKSLSKVFQKDTLPEMLRYGNEFHCSNACIDKAWILELETRRKLKEEDIKIDSSGCVYEREERNVRIPALRYRQGKYHHICAVCGLTKEEHNFIGGWDRQGGDWTYHNSNKLDHAFQMLCFDTLVTEPTGLYISKLVHCNSDTGSPHPMTLREYIGHTFSTENTSTRNAGFASIAARESNVNLVVENLTNPMKSTESFLNVTFAWAYQNGILCRMQSNNPRKLPYKFFPHTCVCHLHAMEQPLHGVVVSGNFMHSQLYRDRSTNTRCVRGTVQHNYSDVENIHVDSKQCLYFDAEPWKKCEVCGSRCCDDEVQISSKLPMMNLPDVYCDHIGLKRKLRGEMLKPYKDIQSRYMRLLADQPEAQVHEQVIAELRDAGELLEYYLCDYCGKLFCHSDHRETHYPVDISIPPHFFVSDADNLYCSICGMHHRHANHQLRCKYANDRPLYTNLVPRNDPDDRSCRNCGADDRTNCFCIRYEPFDISSASGQNPYETLDSELSHLNSIYDYQGMDLQVRNAWFTFSGRVLYQRPINSEDNRFRDNWQMYVLLLGQPGVGKSLNLHYHMRHLHSSLHYNMADPTTDGANQFCLEPLSRHPQPMALCLNEISENSKLDNTLIQQLADGGSSGKMEISVKHRDARSIRPYTQLFITSNTTPPFFTEAICRRTVPFQFRRVVKNHVKDAYLGAKLLVESPAYVMRCLGTYNLVRMKKESLENVLPKEMDALRKRLLRQKDTVWQFFDTITDIARRCNKAPVSICDKRQEDRLHYYVRAADVQTLYQLFKKRFIDKQSDKKPWNDDNITGVLEFFKLKIVHRELPWLDTSKSANWEDGQPPDSVGTELVTTDWIVGMMPDEWNRDIQNEQIRKKKAQGTLTPLSSTENSHSHSGEGDNGNGDYNDGYNDGYNSEYNSKYNSECNDSADEEMKDISNGFTSNQIGQQRLDYQETRQFLQNQMIKLSTDQVKRIKELVVDHYEQRQTHIRKKRRLN